MNQWPKIQLPFSIPDHIKSMARFKEIPRPSKWAEDHWVLTKVYARKGKFRPYTWQKYIIDLVADWLKIYIVAPVRTGKTMLSDIMRGYCIDIYDMGGTVIYPTFDLVKSNFKVRIIPTLEDIPIMRKHLTGKSDDITLQQIILRNCIWNTASAQNKNHLAQYGAQFIYGDEVSKWRVVGFDPDRLIDGRQKDYIGTTNYRKVFSSSPWEVGDIFYKAIYRPGTLIVTPHAICPWCRIAFEWSDYHIKEKLPRDSKLRKDPIRLKSIGEDAVRYECPKCGKEIPEDARYEMIENTIWAAPEIKMRNFEQKADLINPDGTVIHMEDRGKKSIITVNWNRLIDPNYKFYECLAAFFEALKDPKKMRAHQTEDMARFYDNSTKKKTSDYIFAKKIGYCQYGPEAVVPDGVLVIVCCMDTQDNGFYCVHRGYGRDMETWLLRHDFIDAPMHGDAKNKNEVYELVRPQIDIIMKKADGTRMPIVFGLIDRGGHMPGYVDYLCEHISWLHKYVGSATSIDYKKPAIKKSTSDELQHRKLHIGQTRLLSDRVNSRIESSKFHVPIDMTDEYVRQLLAQYYETEVKDNGEETTKFICLPYDHYRDCENLCEGCVDLLGLEERLVSESYIRRIEEHCRNAVSEKKSNKSANITDKEKKKGIQRNRVGGSWLNSRIRRF